MKKLGIQVWVAAGLLLFVLTSPVGAQTRRRVSPSPSPSPTPTLVATESAEVASVSATPIPERNDITEPTGEVKGKLERYLDTQQVGRLSPFNFMRYAVRIAVKEGVPANTIVLVLLFPVVAALVAMARHLIGLRGFGIYIPAVLSVAFVATGVLPGLILFTVILGVTTYGTKILRKLKLQYLPRIALLLWLVSIGVFTTLFIAPLLGITDLATVNIFPILILILLAENFNEVQLGKSKQEATELTIETIILALISALVLSLDFVQRFALLNPELLIVGVAVIDIIVGKYVGLRFTEYLKFKQLLES